MKKKRGKTKDYDISNRAVVLILILVLLISIVSLGVYISTVQKNTTLSGGAILSVDMTADQASSSQLVQLQKNNIEDKNGPTFQ